MRERKCWEIAGSPRGRYIRSTADIPVLGDICGKENHDMPLRDLIILCSDCFNQVRQHVQGDQAISAIIKIFPQNNELSKVLTTLSAL